MPAGKTVATLNARVGLDATQYERGARRVARANAQMRREKERLRRTQQALSREFSRFASTARTVAFRFAAIQGSVFVATRALISMGDELGKMSDRLQLSIGELQSLRLAADSVNVPFTKAARAIQTLQVRFSRLGLDTNSFRTELEALNPELLGQLDNIEDINEAYQLYVRTLLNLKREGRDLEAVQLAQAGFGQGAAQSGIQVLEQQETARNTLLRAGALLTDEDREVFAEAAQSFTDLGSIIKNQALVAVTDLTGGVRDLNETLQNFLTGPIPNIVSAIAVGLSFLGGGRLLVGAGRLAKRGKDYFQAGGRIQFRAGRDVPLGFGLLGAIAGYNLVDDLQEGIERRQELQTGLIDFDPELVERLRDLTNVRRPTQAQSVFRNDRTGRFTNPLAGAESQEIRELYEAIFGQEATEAIIADLDLFDADTSGLMRNYRERIEKESRRSGEQAMRTRAKFERMLNSLIAGDRAQKAQNQRVIDEALRSRLEELRLYYDAAFPDVSDAADPDGPAPLDRATQEAAEAERRRQLEFLSSREVRRPVRHLDEDFRVGDTTVLDRIARTLAAIAQTERDRARQLEVAYVSGQTGRNVGRRDPLASGRIADPFASAGVLTLEDIAEANARLAESQLTRIDKVIREITQSVRSLEDSMRTALVDVILEGRDALEVFGSLVRQVARQLIDSLVASPLAEFFSGVIGSLGSSVASSFRTPPPVPSPAHTGGSPQFGTRALPAFNPPVPGPNVNIVVNGVEDQAAFNRVADRVEASIVPRVVNTVSANVQRPGTIRRIRG